MERFNFVARILHPRTSEFLNRISTVLGSRIRPSNIVFYVGRVHILEAFTPQGGWMKVRRGCANRFEKKGSERRFKVNDAPQGVPSPSFASRNAAGLVILGTLPSLIRGNK